MRPFAIALLCAVLAGCATTLPTATRSAALTTSGPPTLSVATPSASPSPPALEGVSLDLHCGGGLIQSTIIDYANEAPGVTDILAATRALRGVAASDLVVTHGNSTVLIRDGQAIWRGDWFNMGRGFLLGQSSACAGVQIGL